MENFRKRVYGYLRSHDYYFRSALGYVNQPSLWALTYRVGQLGPILRVFVFDMYSYKVMPGAGITLSSFSQYKISIISCNPGASLTTILDWGAGKVIKKR